jgi:MerR family mercuric resistance operon transcriptional regulator
MTRSSSRPGTTRVSPSVGVAPDALRFFGRAGLLPDASPDVEVTPEYRERLRFVQRAQRLGFELHEIRELLAISDGASREMTSLYASIENQVENIEQRIVALMRVRQALLQMHQRLDRHRPHPQCPIVAALLVDSRD